MMNWPWDFGFWWIGGALLSVAFWVAVIYLLLKVANSTSPRRSAGSAIRILDERYARGEITREEYLERRGILEQTSGSGPQATT